MLTHDNKLISPLGGGTAFTAKDMFLENNPNGVFEATNLLEDFLPKTKKAKAKYSNLWYRLWNGNHIGGFLSAETDKNGIEYLWVEIELLRGVEPYKVVLLSSQMFNFFKMYQDGFASVRFNFEELIEEAHRIEGIKSGSPKQSGNFPYISKQFTGTGGTAQIPEQKADENTTDQNPD